mmetsp:Transcript_85190/g.244541  ORF Transcript_85190/g.244541 Transcript_85190/m.244541 type:complete len:248 (-) Transcript_85190:1160-1903(-)
MPRPGHGAAVDRPKHVADAVHQQPVGGVRCSEAGCRKRLCFSAASASASVGILGFGPRPYNRGCERAPHEKPGAVLTRGGHRGESSVHTSLEIEGARWLQDLRRSDVAPRLHGAAADAQRREAGRGGGAFRPSGTSHLLGRLQFACGGLAIGFLRRLSAGGDDGRACGSHAAAFAMADTGSQAGGVEPGAHSHGSPAALPGVPLPREELPGDHRRRRWRRRYRHRLCIANPGICGLAERCAGLRNRR